jgi:signal peptidase I
LLLFTLMGCTMFTLVQSLMQEPTGSTRQTELKQFAGSSMEPNFHDGQIVEIEEVPVAELQRGDVILFTAKGGKQYLKRLIGLPGETVEIRDGKVYINDEVLDEPYINEPAQGDSPVFTVGTDEYFVLGDNRNNSSDSRAFGSVPSENIRGRVKQ